MKDKTIKGEKPKGSFTGHLQIEKYKKYTKRVAEIDLKKISEQKEKEITDAAVNELFDGKVGVEHKSLFISRRYTGKYTDILNKLSVKAARNEIPVFGLDEATSTEIREEIVAFMQKNRDDISIEGGEKLSKVKMKAAEDEFIEAVSNKVTDAMISAITKTPIESSVGFTR